MSLAYPIPAPGGAGDNEPIPFELTGTALGALSVHLEAEILRDADTGQDELVVGDGRHCEPVTPDDLRERIAAARDYLTRLDAMADQYEAVTSPPPGPCFPWCDHDDTLPGEHESAEVYLPIPPGLKVPHDELLMAALYHSDDPSLIRHETEISINTGGSGVPITPEEAEGFADALVTFAARLRRLVQHVDDERVEDDR
jgi:hypothetical protein